MENKAPYESSRRNRPERPIDPIRDAIENGEYTLGVVEWATKAEINKHNSAMLGKSNDPVRVAEIAATLPNPDEPLEKVELGILENAMHNLTLAGVTVPDDDLAYQFIVERVKNEYSSDRHSRVKKSLASSGIRLAQTPDEKK